jgi:hypothetical protein
MPAFIPRSELRVFVSSTMREFGETRTELKAALDRLALVRFVGMENRGARVEMPLESSCNEIDHCHIYLGTFGSTSGHLDPSSGRSVTELEYRYVSGKGKYVSSIF